MAIDSINNVTAGQVGYNPQLNNKTAMEYKDVSKAENAPKVDRVTDSYEPSESNNSGNSIQSEQTVNQERLHKAVEELNKKMGNSEAIFGIHEGTNRVTIKIVDKESKEVIKELPPEKTLDMIARVWEMAGIMVDEFR